MQGSNLKKILNLIEYKVFCIIFKILKINQLKNIFSYINKVNY